MRQRKVAVIEDLKGALGIGADATVFRKLAELEYRTSSSHRGRYYALDEVARFDELGLWSFRAAWSSGLGTLVSTVEALLSSAEAGYDAAEVEGVLDVEAKQALLALVRSGRLARQAWVGATCTSPLRPRCDGTSSPPARTTTPSRPGCGWARACGPPARRAEAAIVLFYSLLDKCQRRLPAGLEAMKIRNPAENGHWFRGGFKRWTRQAR